MRESSSMPPSPHFHISSPGLLNVPSMQRGLSQTDASKEMDEEAKEKEQQERSILGGSW